MISIAPMEHLREELKVVWIGGAERLEVVHVFSAVLFRAPGLKKGNVFPKEQ
jgi:hypothetical protein